MSESITSGSMSWNEIAASAYRAYMINAGFDVKDIPEFSKSSGVTTSAWEAAVRQVSCCLVQSPEFSRKNEATWAGWTPPV